MIGGSLQVFHASKPAQQGIARRRQGSVATVDGRFAAPNTTGFSMNTDSPRGTAAKPGVEWSARNFRFDELDRDSACIPYGKVDLGLPAAIWGKAIRVEGRLIAPDLPYKSRWQPPARVKAFDQYWRKIFHAMGMDPWRQQFEQRLAAHLASAGPRSFGRRRAAVPARRDAR